MSSNKYLPIKFNSKLAVHVYRVIHLEYPPIDGIVIMLWAC